LIENENLILNQKYHKQKLILSFILAGTIIIFIFLSIFYFQFKRQRNTNRILVHKNINIIENEKKLILKQKEYEEIINTLKKENIDSEILDKTEKYASSKLDDVKQIEIIKQIEFQINEKRIFTQSDLTQEKFAQLLKTNKTYLSQVINETYKQNFNNFINELRLKEACRIMVDKEFKHYSIEGISSEVGFNSITTFNRCFKKYTGVTPSVFMTNLA